MIERPILFSGSMVRAILENKKTMTRRLVKPQPPCSLSMLETEQSGLWTYTESDMEWKAPAIPGDRLWVKETFGLDPDFEPYYKASEEHLEIFPKGYWKPSIHMPRGASRITLEVTDVRIEQLQEITEKDAVAEGFERREHFIRAWDEMYSKKPRLKFAPDPWVWVIQFKKERNDAQKHRMVNGLV